MGGKMSRNKGAAFERWVANQLKAAGLPAKRGLGQARSASEVPDVDLPGWWIEAKRHKKCDREAAWRQAVEAAQASGRTPVAICKDDHGQPTATWNAWVEVPSGGLMVRGYALTTVRFDDWVSLLAITPTRTARG
jgi:hypothetical protein